MNQRTDPLVESYKHFIESAPPKTQFYPQHSVVEALHDLALGDADQYHGQAFVTAKLRKHSNTTRWIAVSANLINVLTAIPAFYFGFMTLGSFGLVLTVTLSGLALKFSNDNAAAAAAATKGNRLWSSQGLVTFISINILLTLLSGTGSELLTNRAGLSKQLSKSLTEEQLNQSKPQEPDMSRYTHAAQACRELEQQLDNLPSNSAKRDELVIRAKGSFSSWERDWTKVERSQIPPCWFKDMRDSDPTWIDYQKNLKTWQKLPDFRHQLGNDNQFLQQQFPQVYSKHFTKDGNVLSGTEEFTVAFQSFWGRLFSPNLEGMGQLGFSLFMFLLSVITSAGACIALVAHTYREDTQLSFNPEVEEAVLAHLAYLERAVHHKTNRTTQPKQQNTSQTPPVLPVPTALEKSPSYSQVDATDPPPKSANYNFNRLEQRPSTGEYREASD